MKRLVQFKDADNPVSEVQYSGNILEIRDFVSPDNFRHEFGGAVAIRTFGRNIATVNVGDYVLKYESGRFAVVSKEEIDEYFEEVEEINRYD